MIVDILFRIIEYCKHNNLEFLDSLVINEDEVTEELTITFTKNEVKLEINEDGLGFLYHDNKMNTYTNPVVAYDCFISLLEKR